MLIPILQLLLTAAACFGLWRFWRVLDGHGVTSRIITAGLFIRALGGQLLFWISWLRIPFARSLQIGDGLWFFALDGQLYLSSARELLQRGVKALVLIDATYPSRIFTACLTVFTAAFGVVASTAILLNCLAYLAICAIILRLGDPGAEKERRFALAAVTFGPAMILWSLQPLKDTFFVLLMTAMIAACREWQRLWRNAAAGTRWSMVWCAAAMCAAVYGIAGTRWYVGAVLAAASLIFLALVANLPRPRLAASIAAAVLFLVLGQAFRLGGDGDVPELVRKGMDPRALFQPRAETTRMTRVLATTRRGFENTGGATAIVPGHVLLQPAVESRKPPIETPAPVTGTSAGTDAGAPKIEDGVDVPDPANVPVSSTRAPIEKAAPVPRPSHVPVSSTRAPIEKATPMPIPKARTDAAVARVRENRARVPPSSAHQSSRRLAAGVASGFVAMIIPRALAQPLGLVQIGGGRGFWLFADADTLVFDLVVLCSFAYCAWSLVRRRGRATPLLIFVVVVFAALAGPMIYSVTNFGTMFRLRDMVYVLAALLPLTMARPESTG